MKMIYITHTNQDLNLESLKAVEGTTTSFETVISCVTDDGGNHAGLSFDIKNGLLGGAVTFKTNTASRATVFWKTL